MNRAAFRALRPRATAQIGPDWVLPYWLVNQLDPASPAFVPSEQLPFLTNVTARNWTAIGNIASTWEAIVDPRGLVTPQVDGWSLDWWIGADDRWYVPSREAPSRMRQRLIDAAPVVETAMRIPSGDAVHRAYSIVGGPNSDDDLVIVEIENRSRVPFALALAVRPYNPEALTTIERIEMPDNTTVTVDGRVALLLPKAPARVAASTFAEGDSATVVLEGRAGARDEFPAHLRDDTGMAQAAFVFPLAHTATLRVALPMAASKRGRRQGLTRRQVEPAPSYPTAIPSPAQVASGWAVQSNTGLRLELPDAKWQEAVDANRRFLLVLHDGADITSGTGARHRFSFSDAAFMLAALDRHGFHSQVVEVLRSYPGRQRADGGFVSQSREADANGCALWSMAEHWRLTRDREVLDAVAETVARGAHWIDRTRRKARPAAELSDVWVVAGLRAAADLLVAIGEADGAQRVGRSADSLGGDGDASRSPVDGPRGDDLARLRSLIDAATPTWTWPETIRAREPGGPLGDGHDGRTAAEFLSLVRNVLVREVANPEPGLALCSMIPDDWWGRGVEVHDAPTHFGRLSYAVRWHGERPALLWDLERFDDVDDVRLTAPGLDPNWSSVEARGEALLAPIATRETAG